MAKKTKICRLKMKRTTPSIMSRLASSKTIPSYWRNSSVRPGMSIAKNKKTNLLMRVTFWEFSMAKKLMINSPPKPMISLLKLTFQRDSSCS